MTQGSVGVVVVTYDSAAVIEECLRELVAGPDVEVVVVDNNSADASADLAEAAATDVVRLRANTGFSRACNRGVLELVRDHEWLAFVNPDVRVGGDVLVQCAQAAPAAVGAVTPMLVDARGEPHPDVARPVPTVGATVVRYLLTSRLEWPAKRELRRFRREGGRHFLTPVTSGGCLLVRRRAFAAAGGFSEAYFLNAEDVELCCRIRDGGWLVAVDRSIAVRHGKLASSASVGPVPRMLECARAEVTFFERNRPPWQALAVGAAVTIGAAGRAAAGSGGGEVGSNLRNVVTLCHHAVGSARRALARQPTQGPASAMFVP